MPRGENRPSILLSRDENEQVFALIGPKCQSLASTLVQLFTTEGPGHSEWKKKDTGVLCLIKDNSKRSYFFRIYCLYRKAMIWEHEVYMQIEYKSPRPYLHTFEAEEYMTAFNFANEDEAKLLRSILIEKIELRKHRREERRQRAQLAQRANSTASSRSTSRQNGVAAPPPPPPPPHAPAAPPAAPPLPVPALPPKTATTLTGGYTYKSSSKKPKARKLTKADIGMPLDFKHISHVGWDANKGFDVDNLPEEEMRSFFSKAGVSETQLQDQATRQFIYDFINKHGGLDAVKEELHEPGKRDSGVSMGKAPPAPPAPPVPARSPAPHHPPAPAAAPALALALALAPPSRAPPPPPARGVPPPPPPPAAPAAPPAPPAPRHPPPPRPPQPPTTAPPSVPPPAPPPPPAGAPPPPPPPAPPAPPPPPAPTGGAPTEAPVPPPMDARSALMESIRSGSKGLKKVDVTSAPKPPVEVDSRSNLLSEIRQGIELRAVSKSSHNGTLERLPPSSGCGLADALKRALDERSRAIHSDTDSDDTNDNDSGDDWD